MNFVYWDLHSTRMLRNAREVEENSICYARPAISGLKIGRTPSRRASWSASSSRVYGLRVGERDVEKSLAKRFIFRMLAMAVCKVVYPKIKK